MRAGVRTTIASFMSQRSTPPPLADSAVLGLATVSHTHLAEHCLPHRDIVLTIERWNGGEMARYLSSLDRGEFEQNGRPPGFDFLTRRLISRQDRPRLYPGPSELPDNQRQPYGDCQSANFGQSLAAIVRPCLVGIEHCEWVYVTRDDAFWGYNLSFVDVHQSWRGHGIGTALINQLNSKPWLTGRTLCLTSYTLLGQERLAHVIDGELTSTEFAGKQPWD